jgi:hypothetical protein
MRIIDALSIGGFFHHALGVKFGLKKRSVYKETISIHVVVQAIK